VVLAPLPPEVEAPAPAVEEPAVEAAHVGAIAAPAEIAPEPEPEPEPEFDADIAAIFSEEASELLEQSDSALLRWSRDRADRSQVTELKRLLHTPHSRRAPSRPTRTRSRCCRHRSTSCIACATRSAPDSALRQRPP
jgi:hypothetical protein